MREMKDSGIEWIGELPIGWETRKIKYVATLNGRIGWQGLTSSEYCDDGAYLITGINFDNGQIDWSTCVHVPMERWAEAPQIQIQNGDLLITKDGTVGKVAIVSNMPSETSLNSGVLLIRTVDSCYKKYLFWILQSEIFWKWFNTINAGNSTIIHLYQYDFCNFSFPFPQYSLQCNIANYLDRKCSQIDAIIARQQEVIEKLKAYKLSVITEAVTKGLNSNVPMKDSGIEWIGKVPGNWTKVKLKNICQFINGDRSSNYPAPNEYVDDGIPFLGADSLCGRHVDISQSKKITKEKYQSMGGAKIQEGDILYTLRGSTIGKNAMATFDEGTVASSLMVIRPISLIPEYLLYWLNSEEEFQQRQSYINGSTAPNLSAENVSSFIMFLPSVIEQQEIADYLDKKCAEIESTILKKQLLLEWLDNYKKSLIYEVVTGKKEV